MPALDAVAARMETDGLGTVKTPSNNPAQWPIYKAGIIPGTTPDAIFLQLVPAEPPVEEMGLPVGGVVFENVGLFVQARHADLSAAIARASMIFSKLHRLVNVTLSSVRYLSIIARTSPFPIGRDDAGRWMVGCTYDISKDIG